MTGKSRAQQEMMEAISAVGNDSPMALLYLTRDGADIKIQAGRSDNHKNEQFTLAAMYLLFLEENTSGDLYEVAQEAASVAEQMRETEGVGELHRGGSLDIE